MELNSAPCQVPKERASIRCEGLDGFSCKDAHATAASQLQRRAVALHPGALLRMAVAGIAIDASSASLVLRTREPDGASAVNLRTIVEALRLNA